MSASTSLHVKCRNSAYPRTDGLQRALVPDELVDWRVKWDAYKPINYTHPKVHGKSWADPDIQNSPEVVLNFNQIDGTVDRTSFMGIYQLDSNRIPLNPRGRTGICGRGSLGRWGPNHAADPIVTSRPNDSCAYDTKAELLKMPQVIYSGYVDDPRNTDNAWMETIAVNFHDETGDSIAQLNLQAGDDARKVCWMDVGSEVKLYANHRDFLELVAKQRNAKW
ncbi:ADP-ribose pyrophosphatase mitochondrial [Paragonimus kellicotti]|nr:ADP-ribose pyrophosphatase mitochondrial [Paragonimus kellicotti]